MLCNLSFKLATRDQLVHISIVIIIIDNITNSAATRGIPHRTAAEAFRALQGVPIARAPQGRHGLPHLEHDKAVRREIGV
jgi:hypothetical protein